MIWPEYSVLEQLIERSRNLIRQAEVLKEDQEKLLHELEDLRERAMNDSGLKP
jgi:hypothetical protein